MLYARLKNNDFQHVEDRIDRGLAEARADREAMETRLRESAAAMETRLRESAAAMETRIRESAAAMEAGLRENAAVMESRIGDRIDLMGGRMERMEARILAAVRHLEHPDKTESGT